MSSRRFRSRRSGTTRSADSTRGLSAQGAAMNPHLGLIGGFPDRVRCTLRYSERIVLSPSTTTVQYLFAGNDLYDPNITGTGSQPNNFDDWMVQYTRFKCHGSRARVTCRTLSAGALAVVSIGARGNQATGTVEDDASRPRHQIYWVNANGPPCVYDSSYSTRQILGLTQAQYEGTEALAGTASASPSTLWFWSIRAESFDESTSVPVYVNFTIDYDVEFFQRLDQTMDLFARVKLVMDSKPVRTEKKEESKGEKGYELVELTKLAPGGAPAAGQFQGTPRIHVASLGAGQSLNSGSLFSRIR